MDSCTYLSSSTPLFLRQIHTNSRECYRGHWVLRSLGALYSNCYNVVSFDSLELGTSARNTESLKKLGNFAFFQGDITSSRDIEDCIRRHQIDTVIHLAAQSHVAGGSKDTAGCINSNVQGTFMLLDRANAAGVSRFLFMSSGQVYGSTEPPPFGFTENCPLAPANMYSGSKAAGEMLVMAFGYSTKMKTMIVRPCNVYGPNQFPESKSSQSCHAYCSGGETDYNSRGHPKVCHAAQTRPETPVEWYGRTFAQIHFHHRRRECL